MLAHVRGNQCDTHREDDEPAVIDSDRNAVDARDKDLTFEEIPEGHHLRQKEKVKRQKIRRATTSIRSHFAIGSAALTGRDSARVLTLYLFTSLLFTFAFLKSPLPSAIAPRTAAQVAGGS